MEKNSVDYIVVGQGIAGSCVAAQLLERGRKFIVIDEPSKNNCSPVAAGLFNPVTGQNLVKTWMADILFPYLSNFYRNVEKLTGEKFFYHIPLYRPFASVEEQNEWMGRSSEDIYKLIIEAVYTKPAIDNIHDPLGGLVLKQCGYINTLAFMQAIKKVLIEKGFYRESYFDVTEVKIEKGRVFYGNLETSRIIFCQGSKTITNAFFNKAPIRPLKGESIHIKCDFDKHVIINRGVYMVPGNVPGNWKVGSTYNIKDLSETITESGRHELEQKLTELVKIPFQVTGQQWGIRPTTTDRRPMLGKHPEFGQFVIFNGLGTKGVSLAPYFSNELVRWIEDPSCKLNKEVDVTRFKSLY